MINRAFSKLWIICILFVLIAGGIVAWQYLELPWKEGIIKEIKEKLQGEEIALTPEYPEEYLIFQDYINTIGWWPRVSDIGIIEATVVSITKSEACPYSEEKCRIEPYPKDIGVVRIDKIINYTSYSEQSAEQPIEQPSGEEPSGEVRTTPEYKGGEVPKPKLSEYEPLQVGQEVPTTFLLTVRPVKVRYVSIPPQGEPEPGGIESVFEEPVSRPSLPGEEPVPKTYKPIPKEGDYFVFTTKIIEYPETSQKILPGLEIGSKFQAEIHYDGSLYIEEYTLIQ